MRDGTVIPNGREAKRLRIERGLSQEELAEKVGCAKRTIENVEAGKPVYPRTLAEVAEALGESVEIRHLIISPLDERLVPSPPTSDSPARVGNAPSLPSLVVGRDSVLRDLHRRLTRALLGQGGRPTQVLTAVRGWPGVGKTTIARTLAHRAETIKAFPDGVLWTALGPAPSIFAELIAWARALRADEVLQSASIDEASNHLAGILRNRRMLLIVDDAWQVEHVVPFLVGGPRCAMLITTRLNRVAEELAPKPADIYRLDVLGEKESLDLLATLAPRVVEDNREACRELVRQIEGLPLALQVAGRLLRAEIARGWDVRQLLGELKHDADRILKAKAPADTVTATGEVSPTVTALFQRSTDCLPTEIRRRFAYLAPFAPRPATFELEDLMSVWKVDQTAARETVNVLVDRGLLEPIGNGEYQIHRMLVEHARTLLKKAAPDRGRTRPL